MTLEAQDRFRRSGRRRIECDGDAPTLTVELDEFPSSRAQPSMADCASGGLDNSQYPPEPIELVK